MLQNVYILLKMETIITDASGYLTFTSDNFGVHDQQQLLDRTAYIRDTPNQFQECRITPLIVSKRCYSQESLGSLGPTRSYLLVGA